MQSRSFGTTFEDATLKAVTAVRNGFTRVTIGLGVNTIAITLNVNDGTATTIVKTALVGATTNFATVAVASGVLNVTCTTGGEAVVEVEELTEQHLLGAEASGTF